MLLLICIFISYVLADKVIVGYWDHSDSLPIDQIPWTQITHINYGYAVANDKELELKNKQYLEKLVGLAHQHSVKALLSIGGWYGSKTMSQMVSTPDSRAKFTNTVVEWLLELGLDGIDINWEHPGKSALECNIIDYANDTDNFLLLLRQLRSSLDNTFTTIRISADKKQQPDTGYKLLTASVGTTPFFKNNAPIRDATHFAQVLDWIHIKSFDTYVGKSVIGPNAPLQTSTQDGASPQSVAQAWHAWTTAHMPSHKIVLGLPFSGYAAKPVDDVLGMKRFLTSASPSRPQGDVDDALSIAPCPRAKRSYSGKWKWRSLLIAGVLLDAETPGGQWIKYWDQESQTPWLYQPETRHLISYDDQKSVALKVNFAMCKEARGVSVWNLADDYYDDSKGQLLTVVNELVFNQSSACQKLNPIPAYKSVGPHFSVLSKEQVLSSATRLQPSSLLLVILLLLVLK